MKIQNQFLTRPNSLVVLTSKMAENLILDKKSGIALQNTPALQANYKVKYDTCSFTVAIELMGVSDRG